VTNQWSHQVHEVVIRENDEYEDRPRFLHLVPLGEVLGVAVTRVEKAGDERTPQVKDEDFIFVSMHAFVAALGGLGLSAAPSVGVGLAALAAHEEATK